MDPTFLLTREDWKRLSSNKALSKNKIVSKKYILCYLLGNDENYKKYIHDFSQKVNMPVYYVSSKRKNYKKKQLVCEIYL